METNKWLIDLDYWCPAQIYYYFVDAEGGRWCVYLRWRHEDPWTADIIRCDDEWELLMNSEDNEPLFPTYNLETRSLDDYYRDEDYMALMERVLEVAKVYFPGLEFPNNC